MAEQYGAQDAPEACPAWCLGEHGDERPRVHRGPLRTTPVDARRRHPGHPTVVPSDAHEFFGAQLIQYGGDPVVWISIQTRSGDPIEVALADMNRWIMLLGQVMVDESAPAR